MQCGVPLTGDPWTDSNTAKNGQGSHYTGLFETGPIQVRECAWAKEEMSLVSVLLKTFKQKTTLL